MTVNLVNFAVVALAVGGLAAVIWEVLKKDPHILFEMVSDSRRFAEVPLAVHVAAPVRLSPKAAEAAANDDHPRLAA